MTTDHSRRQLRLSIAAPLAGLGLLLALAVAFTHTGVRIQNATAAYLSGQSVWSRAQQAGVYYLSRYSRSGAAEDLHRAREWLDILLADRRARQAMEADSLDRQTAREQLIRGKNHPDDVDGMIWLYRHFSDWPQLRPAVAIWKRSDGPVLDLADIAKQLEQAWAGGTPDPGQLDEIRYRLERINARLDPMTSDFRDTLTQASRWLADTLALVSAAFVLLVALLAGLLIWRLLYVLRRSEHKFRAIFEQAAVGIAQIDREGRLRDVNPALCRLLGAERERLLGLPFNDLVDPEDWPLAQDRHRQLQRGQLEYYTLEQRVRRAGGRRTWCRMTVSRRTDRSAAAHDIAIVEDISESRRLSAELSYQANHDALTGLFNRRAFERRLSESLDRARREDSVHVLAFIDLDQFKVVNDTSGHIAGDRLLQQVVELLQRSLREGDMLARLGGDEFGVILENCELDDAARLMEQVRKALEETPFVWNEARYQIGCSVGLVAITAEVDGVEALLKGADIACYLAKEQGRNRVHVGHDNDREQLARQGEMEWVHEIHSALDNDRMRLEAQRIEPVVGKSPGPCYEVLVRLEAESGELVAPGVFLPAAERFGSIGRIDRWVVEQVFRQLAAHPRHLSALISCHINLSADSLSRSELAGEIEQWLEQYAIPPAKICFEITETAAINHLPDALLFMERLGRLGCRFALDDFGTGLSSFSYLRRLPVDCLKIDGVFVRDIARDRTDRAMVRAINEIGRTLGKCTIAEFVESREALDCLAQMGVEQAQGFAVHRPCPLDELLCEQDP